MITIRIFLFLDAGIQYRSASLNCLEASLLEWLLCVQSLCDNMYLVFCLNLFGLFGQLVWNWEVTVKLTYLSSVCSCSWQDGAFERVYTWDSFIQFVVILSIRTNGIKQSWDVTAKLSSLPSGMIGHIQRMSGSSTGRSVERLISPSETMRNLYQLIWEKPVV